MKICWRCGVRFDPSEYTAEAPCFDCQEATNTVDQYVNHWKLRAMACTPEAWAKREADIRRLHALNLPDTVIAKRLRISKKTVYNWRHVRLGLPKSTRPNSDFWTTSKEERTEKFKATMNKKAAEGTLNRNWGTH